MFELSPGGRSANYRNIARSSRIMAASGSMGSPPIPIAPKDREVINPHDLLYNSDTKLRGELELPLADWDDDIDIPKKFVGLISLCYTMKGSPFEVNIENQVWLLRVIADDSM